MKAKFILNQITRAGTDTDPAEELTFNAVTDKGFDDEGNSDDNDFARFTPSGELKMLVNNPAIVGTMKTGQKFYLDFTLADD